MASPSSSIVAVLLLLLFFLHGSFTVCSSSDDDDAGSSSKPQKAKLLGDGGERGGQNPEKNPILKAKKQTVLLKPTVSAADAAGSSSKAKLLIRRSVGEGDGGERGQNPEKNPILKTTVSAADAAGSSSKAQKAKLLIRRSVGEGDGGEREQNLEKNPILKAKQQTKIGKSFNATLKASNSSKQNSNSTKSSKDKLKSSNSASNSTKSSKKFGLDSPIAKNKMESSVEVNEKVKTAAKQGAKTEELAAGRETEDELDDGGADIISDFRELPSRLLPDLERLSVTSKAYISAANKGIAEGVKPYVGKSFAPKVAPVLSSLFLVPPLLLLFLILRRLRAYISHHRLLLFTQAHLAIYFGTLMLTALATGLEPLCFFYATWPASYVWTQAAQTMGYLIYLVLQLSDLVSLFSGSKDSHTASSRSLALAQMVIGLAVGIHYYAAVFHRAVCGEPPRVNWRVHGMYATCFLAICMCARADRRKKAYCDCEGGEVGKKN